MDYSSIIADLDSEIAKLQKARDTLTTLNGQSAVRNTRIGKSGKTMSASARRRISLAKKKWWATRKKS